MSDTKSSKEDTKFACVRVLQIIEIGNHRYAPGHVIEKLPLADAEYRKSQGEVTILRLVP